MKKLNKIAIVGAGPAGLTAAYKLSCEGKLVEVYEASFSVGGMAKTIPLWGQLVDLGPHRFFSSDPRVNTLWLELADKNYSMVSRLTRILYKKKFFNYPLKPFNALSGLGLFESLYCVYSYFYAKINVKKKTDTFENWVIDRFGKRLYEIFFKSYSEKLWGIKCNELDSDFAAQRIKKLSLFEAIKSSFIKSQNTEHKTLVDEFAYPHYGSGLIYDRMAKKILENKGKIKLKTPVKSIIPDSKGKNVKINLLNGESEYFDHVISSMPITSLIQQMDAPIEIINYSKKLKFRNTILVYLLIDESNLFPDQWIYVHSKDLKTGRITNFSNWVTSINNDKKETILCLEYWCNDDENLWTEDEGNLINLASREICQTNLVKSSSIKEGRVFRVPKCYPVYSSGYKMHLNEIQKFISKQKGIEAIGRYGSFKYNNQDHSILMGILAAENVLFGTNHNLWELNTDYEYQESSKITKTGLAKL